MKCSRISRSTKPRNRLARDLRALRPQVIRSKKSYNRKAKNARQAKINCGDWSPLQISCSLNSKNKDDKLWPRSASKNLQNRNGVWENHRRTSAQPRACYGQKEASQHCITNSRLIQWIQRVSGARRPTAKSLKTKENKNDNPLFLLANKTHFFYPHPLTFTPWMLIYRG